VFLQQQPKNSKWHSLDLENGAAAAAAALAASATVVGCGGSTGRPPFKTQRSSSMPTPKSSTSKSDLSSTVCRCVDSSPCGGELKERSTRGSVSNENNILLDPDVLTDYPTQALLLTVLVCLIPDLRFTA